MLLVAACSPDPTPLPVVPVETTPSPETTALQPADVLAIDRLTYSLLTAEQLKQIESAAEVHVTDTVGADMAGSALSVAPFAGAEVASYTLPLAFWLNNASPPLDDPVLAQAISNFLAGDPDRNALRTALANTGHPDGLMLRYTGSFAPDFIQLLFAADAPLRWRAVPEPAEADIVFGAGAGAVALMDRGGRSSGSLRLYLSAGWQLSADSAGLPLLERAEEPR